MNNQIVMQQTLSRTTHSQHQGISKTIARLSEKV